MDTKDIRRRFQGVESSRTTAQEEWDLIRRFIYPIGGGKFWEPQKSEHEMNWREREVYDDTAIIGTDTLASSLHSALTPPSTRWFDAKFRHRELQQNDEAVQWLSDAMGKVWDELQDSNFDLEIAEFYLHVAAFGNAAIAAESPNDLEFDGMHFSTLPLKECYFESDSKGNITHFYRRRPWRPEELVTKFGAATPERIREQAERGETEGVTVLFALYPNPDAAKNQGELQPVAKRKYNAKYMLYDSAEQLGDTVGYYDMPVTFGRWRRAVGSVWGYGPGHLALPSVLTLNQLKRLILVAAEKVIDPAVLTTERGVIGDVDLDAGGITVVRDVAAIVPFESGARVDVSQLEVAKLQEGIRDLFRMNQLELAQGPQMTATEVEVRYELMHRLFGPSIARIRDDVLDKIIQRVFAALARAGELPPPPKVITDSPSDIDIHYLGPMARAQKADKVNTIHRWASMGSEIGQMVPATTNSIKGDEVMRELAREMGIPMSLTRDEDETDYIQTLEQQLQQMQMQLEEAMKSQNPPPSDGGPPA